MSAATLGREGWVIELHGDQLFLEDLPSFYRQGSVRVSKRGTQFYLEADTIDVQPDCWAVEREGIALLRTMLGLARMSPGTREGAKPIAAIRRAADGTWRERFDLNRATFATASGIRFMPVVEGPTLQERTLALVLRDPRVKSALDDLAGDLDLPRLRRVYETMWTEFDSKQSEAERKIVTAGLARKTELDRFSNTVNRSPEEAAHSPFKYDPYPDAMPLTEACWYLGGLLARWIGAKLQSGADIPT